MMKRENLWKAAISGVLLLTLIATGITLYNSGKDDEPKEKNEAQLVEQTEDDKWKDEPFEMQDVSNQSATAEDFEKKEQDKYLDENDVKPVQVTEDEYESKDTTGDVLPALNFTEDSVLDWPVNGNVLIDYSMETTTYFSTLNQYKCCDGVILGTEIGTKVLAAANGKVVSIAENEETGMTVSMDLGNGYRAVYGQLRGLRAKVGDIVEQGDIIGYVDSPTKYFVKEGSNLYFSMMKDGMYIDPMMYLDTVVE